MPMNEKDCPDYWRCLGIQRATLVDLTDNLLTLILLIALDIPRV